jgi:hypothetical protein
VRSCTPARQMMAEARMITPGPRPRRTTCPATRTDGDVLLFSASIRGMRRPMPTFSSATPTNTSATKVTTFFGPAIDNECNGLSGLVVGSVGTRYHCMANSTVGG